MSSSVQPTSEQTARIAMEWATAQGAVSAYVRGLVSDRTERDDVLQQTVLYLIEHAAEYEGNGFVHWALRVAHFRVLDHWKRKKRGGHWMPMAEALETAVAEIVPPDETRLEALRTCLGHLQPEHRRLVERRYGEGLDLAALSKETGRTAGTLATALHRIRSSLADCIKKKLALAHD